MQVYNVEVFHRDFSFVHNYTVEDITYKYDYLTPVENEVMMSYNANVKMGDYIVLQSEDRRYEGVISSIQIINKEYMKIGYYPLNTLFSFPCYIDLRYQKGENQAGTKSIESIIYDLIDNAFVDGHDPNNPYYGIFNTDNLQKIQGLTLTKTTDTMLWNIGLSIQDTLFYNEYYWKGDICNDVIPRALKGCSVGVITRLDVQAQKVYCTIGVINPSTKTIEADLPQILAKNIVENDTSMMCNKFFVYPSTETGEDPKVYYRHSDGTWNTTNTDRLTPVIADVSELMSETHNDTIETELFNKYGALNYVNLIELTTQIDTYGLEFGDVANVIVGNNTYVSMLTGYEIHGDIIKYIFGMLRLDLTKILKRRL